MSCSVNETEGRMKISIVIPALNEESRIAQLIEELLRRKSSGDYIHEIIVADGGSSDQTQQVSEEAGAAVLLCRKKGRAVQMNEGADMASGDVLYFLHADTVPPHQFDREIIRAITTGAGAGCFRLQFTSDHLVLRFYAWCTRFKTTLVRFGDQSLFVTSEIFRTIGGFDEELVVMEDQKIVRNIKEITSFRLLDEAVETSARKYEKNGVVRLQFIFGLILILYYIGARQDTLVHLYRSLIEI